MKRAFKKVLRALRLAALGVTVLGLVIFTVWRVWLSHDVTRQLAEIRAAGLPTSGEEANTYYTAVPDEKNAALKMEGAFLLLTNYTESRERDLAGLKLPPRGKTLSPEELETIAGFCAMNSNALAAAKEAVKLKDSRYPIDLSWGAGTLLPHLKKLKQLALIAGYESLLRTNDSASDIATMVGMAHTLDKEPIIISKLVGTAILSMAVATAEQRLNAAGLPDAELAGLGQLFIDADQTNQMANGLIGERAMYIRYFRMSWGDIRKYSNQNEEADHTQDTGPAIPGPQPFLFRFTGFFERDLRFFLQTMDTNISLAMTYPKNVAHIEAVGDEISHASRRNFYIMSSMFLPALPAATFKEASGLALLRSARTAFAVERFRQTRGALPETLDRLVPQFFPAVPQDPFDGQPLRYHVLEKGYVVYSVGRDGEDNGGRERPADAKSSDQTHYDLTFKVER